MRRYTRKKRLHSVKKGGNHKCLFVRSINGIGLGNMLFLYAAALVVKKNFEEHAKNMYNICFVGSTKGFHSHIDYKHLFDATYDVPNSRVNSAKNAINTKHFNEWSKDNMKLNVPKEADIKLPQNFFQNYKSIEPAIDDMKKMLIKNEFHKPVYHKFKIDQKHSAFMHVRRGDYSKTGWLLGDDYYCSALKHLAKKDGINYLYVFSDDIEWCVQNDNKWKECLGSDKKIIYDTELFGTTTKDAKLNELETLYCMTLCEAGAVITNSTFSLWGVMLGADRNSDSMIVYPEPWVPPWIDGTKESALSFPKDGRWVPVTYEKK